MLFKQQFSCLSALISECDIDVSTLVFSKLRGTRCGERGRETEGEKEIGMTGETLTAYIVRKHLSGGLSF